MTSQTHVIAPNVTPFNADYSVDTALYVEHASKLLADGATMLAPFGTTGEANSLGLTERMQLLEALVAAGIPAAKIVPGTGLCAAPDTIALSKHAIDLGCAGVMTLPPFYYKDVSDDGLYASFARMIESAGHGDLRVYLYHIPQISGVGLSIPLVRRLAKAFPTVIIGIKDSSGDWNNTTALLSVADDFAVFPGNELQLRRSIKAGAAGCITATANLNATIIRQLADNHSSAHAPDLEALVDGYRQTIQPHGLITAIKAVLAQRDRHDGWTRVRAPLLPFDPARLPALVHQLTAIGERAAAMAP